MALGPLRALVDAQQRGYWIHLLLAAQGLLITGLSLLGAWAGWGITGQALAVAVGILPAPVVLAWLGLRGRPGLLGALRASRPDPEVGLALRALSGPTLVQNLSGRLGLLTDAIVAGRLLGLEAPAVLFVTQRLAALAQAQLQGIGGASWAGLAELHAQGRTDVFNRRLVELTWLVAALGVAALAPIVAYNRRFFELWMLARMGPQGYGGDTVAAVAAFNALVLAVVSLWNWCFSGTGQVHRVAGASALGAAINLAAGVALTPSLGVVGPLLGTTIAYLSIRPGSCRCRCAGPSAPPSGPCCGPWRCPWPGGSLTPPPCPGWPGPIRPAAGWAWPPR